MKPAGFGIGLMAPDAIDGDTQQFRLVPAELRQYFVVERQLIATDWTPIGRIKGKDDRFASEIAERQPLVRRNSQLEIRRTRPRRKNLSHFNASCRIPTESQIGYQPD